MRTSRPWPQIPVAALLAAAVLIGAAALAGRLATPRQLVVTQADQLEQAVPQQIGPWRHRPSPLVQVGLTTGTETSTDQPYDQVVLRTYIGAQGEQVQLALAWGQRQRQEVKVHRPDLCYVAQGWQVRSLQPRSLDGLRHAPPRIAAKRMLAQSGGQGFEAVSYWMRIGDVFSEDAWETRGHILREGLVGRIPDGILVRASVRVRSPQEAEQAWATAERFLADLMAELDPQAASMLVGRSALAGAGA